jgi:hypothetical protein
MEPSSCSQDRSTAVAEKEGVSSPIRAASSAWLGEQMSMYGRAFVVFSNSEGVQRSGT